jgi:hypothetical protein
VHIRDKFSDRGCHLLLNLRVNNNTNRYEDIGEEKWRSPRRLEFPSPSPASPLVRPPPMASQAIEVWWTLVSRWWRVPVSCFRVFYVFFRMVRRWRYPEVRIRSSPPYPHFDGAPSATGGHVEFCLRRIFSDLFSFGIRWCGFRSVSSDLLLSSLTMIAALVCWSSGALA